MKIDNFLSELKRRNVYKVAVAYAVVGWLLVQMVAGAWYQGLLGYAYAISGDRPKAEQILRELEQMAKRQYVSTTAFADIHLGLGEKEKALDWLEKSYQDQESACWYLKVDPIYDRVRNEPRFQALVQRVFGSNL